MERRTAVDADRAPPAVEVGGGQDPQYKVAAEHGVSADGATLLVSGYHVEGGSGSVNIHRRLL
jgi:hypothetical protein